MREILFRGLTVYSKEWAYGGYHKGQTKTWIILASGVKIDVIPGTVGQFTGMFDVRELPVYEDDKLWDTETFLEGRETFVGWDNKNLCYRSYFEKGQGAVISSFDSQNLKVIGTIHDHLIPEKR